MSETVKVLVYIGVTADGEVRVIGDRADRFWRNRETSSPWGDYERGSQEGDVDTGSHTVYRVELELPVPQTIKLGAEAGDTEAKIVSD